MTNNQRNIITSATNPLIKQMRGLDRKKNRYESGLFLVEGTRLIAQGLKNGWIAETLIVAQSMLSRPPIREIVSAAENLGARIAEVPEKLIGKISRKDNPQAMIAAFQQQRRSLSDLEHNEDGIWICLYEVRDPGNMGTILRTADCVGAAGLVLINTCCDAYSVEAVRASMGSIFDVPFAQSDFSAFNRWRQAQGLRLVAASVNGTKRHDQEVYGHRTALLMGNEQAGLPPEIEDACDQLVLIPMRGGADSLNLAQATAIITYEAWRQRGFA